MRLGATLLPDALQAVWPTPISSARSCAPARCVLGLLLGCTFMIASRTSALIGFLPARAPFPLSLSKRRTTIDVGFLSARNRRLRYPSLALDADRAEAATEQQQNARAWNHFLLRPAISDEPSSVSGYWA